MAKTTRGTCSARSILCLAVLILAAGLAVFSRFLFGNETLVYEGVGSDTRQQYIMWYNSIVNHLRSGTFSFWDFTNGFGGSMFNYYLFAPFLLVIYGLGSWLGPASLAGMMVYLILAQILLAGLLCYVMLSQWELREEAKVLTAFLYAFNGYLVVWGQHYALGFVCLELPLFILVAEKAIRDRIHCFTLALVSGLVILSGYYQGYMVLLGMALYVTIRVLVYEALPMRRRLGTYLAMGTAMGFGVLLGGINLLPSAGVLSVTSRLNQEGTLLQRFVRNLAPYGREYYRTLLYRLFGSNLQGSGRYFVGDGNYYEAVNLFLGTLTILMALQFVPALWRAGKARRENIAVGLGVLLSLFLVLVKAGSLAFNGFAYAFSRHTFLLLPFMAMMTCFTLSEILKNRRISLAGLLLGAAVCAAVYGKAYVNYASRGDYQRNALVLLAAALVSALALWLYSANRLRRSYLCLLLGLAVLAGTVSDTWLSYNGRSSVKKTDPVYFGTYDGDTAAALAWIASEDDQFYRVEKDYSEASYYLDSMAQGYASATTYNSQQSSQIQRMVTQICPRLLTGYDQNHYDFRSVLHEQGMASLFGIKYILSHEDDLQVAGYELLRREGEVYIYRNTGTENIARFFTATISEKQYKQLKEEIPRWNLVDDLMVTRGKTGLEVDSESLLERGVYAANEALVPSLAYQITDDGASGQAMGAMKVSLDPAVIGAYAYTIAEFDLLVDGAADVDVYTNDGRPVSYFVRGTAHFALPLPEGTTSLTIRTREQAQVFSLQELEIWGSPYRPAQAQEAVCRVDAPTKDSELTGSVETDQAGYLMLAMPYQEGWSAYLDGAPCEQVEADFGFTALRVPAGSHTFRLVYRAPLFREGALLSGVSLLVWTGLLVLVLARRRGRRRSGEAPQGSSFS